MAVLEKHSSNAQIHLLLRCQDWSDQFWTGMFLLEMLDNVDKERRDASDDYWQHSTWELVEAGFRSSKDLLWTRTSSILTPLAPAGTAMVQMVRSAADLEKVCDYITKTWNQTTHQLASRLTTANYDQVLDCKLLSEFHQTVDPAKYARIWRIDPRTGGRVLDLDMPLAWKSMGRVLR